MSDHRALAAGNPFEFAYEDVDAAENEGVDCPSAATDVRGQLTSQIERKQETPRDTKYDAQRTHGLKNPQYS